MSEHERGRDIGLVEERIGAAERASFEALSAAGIYLDEDEGEVIVEELRRVCNRLRALTGDPQLFLDGDDDLLYGKPERSPGGHILRALVEGIEPPKIHGVCCAEVRAVYPGLALLGGGDAA